MKTTLYRKISSTAKTLGIQNNKLKGAIDIILKMYQNDLKEYNKINFFDTVIIEIKDRKAKKGRNPMTKEIINIPAGKKLRARAGKYFKTLINE